ncbi:MAG: tRNA-(ms[2]io[6]A)-hydroxylase [Woeseia sp.]
MALTRTVPRELLEFLATPTPPSWLEEAVQRTPLLLLDHANCELKAASSALAIIYRYAERDELVWRMSRLAREELRHFEQVRKILRDRKIPFARLTASRYASAMHDAVRRDEPHRLLDTLIVGALIEARSCERFAALVPLLPPDLAEFYRSLLASEARHFEQYLQFARSECDVANAELLQRTEALREIENAVITAPDTQFRFHSGQPTAA